MRFSLSMGLVSKAKQVVVCWITANSSSQLQFLICLLCFLVTTFVILNNSGIKSDKNGDSSNSTVQFYLGGLSRHLRGL